MKPSYLHTRACSIVILVPQSSQHVSRLINTNPYLLCIASLHLSFDRESPLVLVGWMKNQALVSVLQVVQGVGVVIQGLQSLTKVSRGTLDNFD